MRRKEVGLGVLAVAVAAAFIVIVAEPLAFGTWLLRLASDYTTYFLAGAILLNLIGVSTHIMSSRRAQNRSETHAQSAHGVKTRVARRHSRQPR